MGTTTRPNSAADSQAAEEKGRQLLSIVAKEDCDTTLCLRLIEEGAALEGRDTFDLTPLMWSVIRGHTAIARALLSHGADAHKRSVQNHNNTLLLLAAKHSLPDIVSDLLSRNIPVNAQDKDGWTALMWAAGHGDENLAMTLINHGADTSIKNDVGDRAHKVAANNGHTQLAKKIHAHYTAHVFRAAAEKGTPRPRKIRRHSPVAGSKNVP
ncbi:MAG: ankyrin repeat domain-containing protein [Alphaproteobacteria bacterium]|nr:ankyrin repeat domain-containing protein [Alphaproteobacteria bacterium]